MMAVRLEASMPSVTISAVEAEPNPLGPGLPVINDTIPTIVFNCPLAQTIFSKLVFLSNVTKTVQDDIYIYRGMLG